MIDTLKTHGGWAPIVGTIPSFIETVSPYLAFASLLIGIAIGVITLTLKLREFRK